MTERPILFSAPMVRALLAGTKTQTRRVIKRQPWVSCSIEEGGDGESPFVYSALGGAGPGHDVEESRTPCRPPYGQPGDRLWVRETTAEFIDFDTIDGRDVEIGRDIVYRADGEDQKRHSKWRPSIHMPRERSRILLEITGVRVERLQDISEADAQAEGIIPHVRGGWHWHKHDPGNLDDWHQFGFKTAAFAYQGLWESINGAGSWAANPWVWVVEFRRIDG